MTSITQNRQRYQAMLKSKYRQNRPSGHGVTGINETSSSDEESMDELELEEERMLSEKFGEAGEESNSSKKKKRKKRVEDSEEFQNDKLAQKQAKLEEVTKAKSRPTLTASQLISGPNSFLMLKNELKDGLRWGRVPSSDPAARLSTDMINLYKSYCYKLCPTLAFEDALSRIQKLSSSREMRNHLQSMRQDVCRDYLIKQHGREKTEQLLRDLDEYQASLFSSEMDGFDNTHDALPTTDESHSKENVTKGNDNTNMKASPTENSLTPPNKYNKKNKRTVQESDDEEEEAIFDDIVGKSKADED